MLATIGKIIKLSGFILLLAAAVTATAAPPKPKPLISNTIEMFMEGYNKTCDPALQLEMRQQGAARDGDREVIAAQTRSGRVAVHLHTMTGGELVKARLVGGHRPGTESVQETAVSFRCLIAGFSPLVGAHQSTINRIIKTLELDNWEALPAGAERETEEGGVRFRAIKGDEGGVWLIAEPMGSRGQHPPKGQQKVIKLWD